MVVGPAARWDLTGSLQRMNGPQRRWSKAARVGALSVPLCLATLSMIAPNSAPAGGAPPTPEFSIQDVGFTFDFLPNASGIDVNLLAPFPAINEVGQVVAGSDINRTPPLRGNRLQPA